MGIKTLVKSLILACTAAVAVPYTVSVLCNILYGWPTTRNGYRRALHPLKVIKVNYALLKQLGKLKYLRLFLKIKFFYKFSGKDRLIKNIAYGTNDNRLDIYVPDKAAPNLPVVLFIYGGTWSSGDKSMYCLLCTEISKHLNAIVCCPNYSIYPKGYVDDMIQDVVDCIEWVINNIDQYNGDEENIMLIGHSAGAHLCVMSTLELLTKQMLQGPPLPTTSIIESMRFIDRHFDGSNNSSNDDDNEKKNLNVLGDSMASVSSFVVLNGKEHEEIADVTVNIHEVTPLTESAINLPEQPQQASLNINTESYLMVSSDAGHTSSLGESSGSIELLHNSDEEEQVVKDTNFAEKADIKDNLEASDCRKEPAITETMAASLSRRPSAKLHEMHMTKSQQELYELFTAIRCVIGLAGVYHIGNHFEYEIERGIEDISAMGRVMYGTEHFERFSPTVIVENLPDNSGLPPIVLMHGLTDNTVAYSQSTDFATALSGPNQEITVRLLPECGHRDICADLMDPKRPFYPVVMEIITQTARRVLL